MKFAIFCVQHNEPILLMMLAWRSSSQSFLKIIIELFFILLFHELYYWSCNPPQNYYVLMLNKYLFTWFFKQSRLVTSKTSKTECSELGPQFNLYFPNYFWWFMQSSPNLMGKCMRSQTITAIKVQGSLVIRMQEVGDW